MATCPECGDVTLHPTLLANSLPAYSCGKWEGVLLSLIAYRRWREVHSTDAPAPEPGVNDTTVEDSAGAKACPKCRAVMTKYRIASDVSNRLDYCDHCEDVWLDHGEWRLVEKLASSGQLAEIIIQPWQRRIRENLSDSGERARLRELLGEDYERLVEFRTWLNAHAARDRLLACLVHRRPPAR